MPKQSRRLLHKLRTEPFPLPVPSSRNRHVASVSAAGRKGRAPGDEAVWLSDLGPPPPNPLCALWLLQRQIHRNLRQSPPAGPVGLARFDCGFGLFGCRMILDLAFASSW